MDVAIGVCVSEDLAGQDAVFLLIISFIIRNHSYLLKISYMIQLLAIIY
jgi:hypothetical protein